MAHRSGIFLAEMLSDPMLYALGTLLEVPLDEILVSAKPKLNKTSFEQQALACCSPHFIGLFHQLSGIRQKSELASTIFRKALAKPDESGVSAAP